jgi:hypothetical protein
VIFLDMCLWHIEPYSFPVRGLTVWAFGRFVGCVIESAVEEFVGLVAVYA